MRLFFTLYRGLSNKRLKINHWERSRLRTWLINANEILPLAVWRRAYFNLIMNSSFIPTIPRVSSRSPDSTRIAFGFILGAMQKKKTDWFSMGFLYNNEPERFPDLQFYCTIENYTRRALDRDEIDNFQLFFGNWVRKNTTNLSDRQRVTRNLKRNWKFFFSKQIFENKK